MWFVYLIFQFNQEIYFQWGVEGGEKKAESYTREQRAISSILGGRKYNESIQEGKGAIYSI